MEPRHPERSEGTPVNKRGILRCAQDDVPALSKRTLKDQTVVEDARDLLELEMARDAEGDAPTVPLAEVAKRFGIKIES